MRSTSRHDVEKDGQTAHVLLSVAGMDCSGCANNLARALNGAKGTRNVQVVFVTGIAEFDVDLEATNIETVTALAEKATRYKLTPFSTDTATLPLFMAKDVAKRFADNLPTGVESCESGGKGLYIASYDPCLTGARYILEASEGQLPPPEHGADSGRCLVIDKGVKTALALGLSMPVVVLAWGDPPVSRDAKLWTSFALATAVQAIAYPEFYKPALSSLWYNHVVEMDMLVVISITAAYGYSVVALGLELAGYQLEIESFFETSSLLIALVLLGRFISSWARRRAVAAVSLKSLQAPTAVLCDGGQIDARLLHCGDVISIPPHSNVVTDAIVITGSSEVDESMLTGESMPVAKQSGSTVIAGTINGPGLLTAKVSRLPGKNTIDDIAGLVAKAQNARPRVQELADRVAGWFVPVVVAAAIIVAIAWGVVSRETGTALSYAIAVLAISCPCALGLAVPMVLVVAGGLAARGGIIIKSVDVTERGFKVTDVVFDKTGTLTQPELEVVHEEGNFSLVKAVVAKDPHPVAKAVAASLEKHVCQPLKVTNVKSVPGGGIECLWEGKLVRAGNPRWAGAKVALEGTVMCLTVDGELTASFALKSTLRPEANRVVEELRQRRIAVHIVSGDAPNAVNDVANSLGIEHVAAQRTPAQKQDYVRALMDEGKTVLFCGDGTNDAVAVAQAHVGVQMESSSDVTRATADVVLLGSLEGVVQLLDVSKAAFRRIVFNFVWSAVYNFFAIILAGGATVKFRIPPAYAGLGEIVSVLPVIAVALTMPKVKKLSP
jgi:Cd2+-exporting ATPase